MIEKKYEIIWNEVIDEYKKENNNQLFNDNVINKTKLVEFENNNFVVLVNEFSHLELLDSIKKDLLNKLIQKNGNDCNLLFVDNWESKSNIFLKINFYDEIDKNATFSNYVIGEFNNNAYKLVKEVIKTAKSQYSPIFIYSKTGLGKTHLLNAAANEINKNFPDKKLRYVNAQTFLKEIFELFEQKKNVSIIEEFKNLYSNYDILIIDDIQYLADKSKTNEILFTIFNNLILKKKTIILSSDRAPHELNGFEDRMISRFSSGISCRITEPELNSLKAIINNTLQTKNVFLNNDAVEIISNVFNKDIRGLIGVLNKIIFFNSNKKLDNKTILDATEVKNILEINNFVIGNNKNITLLRPTAVIDKIAKIYNIKVNDITNNSRKKNIVIARHVCMYIMREYGKYQLKEIGNFLGNRDHTTVLNGIEKIKSQILKDKEFSDLITSIVKKINF